MLTEPVDLVLDVGNTRTKVALVAASGVLRHGVTANGDAAAVRSFLEGSVPKAIALGSVARPNEAYVRELQTVAPVLVIDGVSPSPLKNTYGTLNTLGADRLANVVAALLRFPGRPFLVIDPGTCITYDLCEADGTYMGGAISPGLRMRAAAMNAYSARLPLVEPPLQPMVLGATTETSLAAGIHHGIRGEMEGFIRSYGKERPGLCVILTGGDAVRFARALESGIFALPFLTLDGYHALLNHHRSLHGDPVPPVAGGAGGSGPAG